MSVSVSENSLIGMFVSLVGGGGHMPTCSEGKEYPIKLVQLLLITTVIVTLSHISLYLYWVMKENMIH